MESEIATISTMSVMMSVSLNRLCPKEVLEEISTVEQVLSDKKKVDLSPRDQENDLEKQLTVKGTLEFYWTIT